MTRTRRRVLMALAWSVALGLVGGLMGQVYVTSGQVDLAVLGLLVVPLWPWMVRRPCARPPPPPKAALGETLSAPLAQLSEDNAALLAHAQRGQHTDAVATLTQTQAAIAHLVAIVQDATDRHLFETGQVRVREHDTALAPLVQQAFDLLAQRAQVRGLDYRLELDPTVPSHVRTDAARLKQVLVNLLSNAIKFTPSGSVHLTVSVHNEGVVFAVQDTGIGIDDAQQGHLFQPFEQANDTVQSRYGGYGLGLSIVAQLVHAMGGQLGFQSELGKGSRFWFWLPLSRLQLSTQPSEHKPGPTP